MSKTVTLPDIPGAGVELEDYIAALFQASGHFVEKQVVEADPLDLLELDIVVTKYSPKTTSKRLVEVKGGRWGYTDLFKVLGWMQYLNISEAAFFVTDWFDLTGADKRMAPLDLKIVRYNNFRKASTQFESDGFGSLESDDLVELWRHSYTLERRLIGTVLAGAKGTHEGAKDAKTYYKLINNGTFFAQTPQESLRLLYEAYVEHPKLSLGYALELDGGSYDPSAVGNSSPTYTQALRGGHPQVQACMYLEHRARISILKAAVDYVLLHPQGPPRTETGTFAWDDLDSAILPQTFKAGLKWLMAQPHFRLYPTFWQQFLWGWGGVVLSDRENEEYGWMSKYSGIPADEIPTALEAFDHFFPSGSWFSTIGTAPIRMLKMTPYLFQGLGAHHRRVEYGHDDLSKLGCGDWGTHMLGDRINKTVDFLLPD